MQQAPGKHQSSWLNWLAATAMALAGATAAFDGDTVAGLGLIALAIMIALSAAADLTRRGALRWLAGGLGLLALILIVARLVGLFTGAA